MTIVCIVIIIFLVKILFNPKLDNSDGQIILWYTDLDRERRYIILWKNDYKQGRNRF